MELLLEKFCFICLEKQNPFEEHLQTKLKHLQETCHNFKEAFLKSENSFKQKLNHIIEEIILELQAFKKTIEEKSLKETKVFASQNELIQSVLENWKWLKKICIRISNSIFPKR